MGTVCGANGRDAASGATSSGHPAAGGAAAPIGTGAATAGRRGATPAGPAAACHDPATRVAAPSAGRDPRRLPSSAGARCPPIWPKRPLRTVLPSGVCRHTDARSEASKPMRSPGPSASTSRRLRVVRTRVASRLSRALGHRRHERRAPRLRRDPRGGGRARRRIARAWQDQRGPPAAHAPPVPARGRRTSRGRPVPAAAGQAACDRRCGFRNSAAAASRNPPSIASRARRRRGRDR